MLGSDKNGDGMIDLTEFMSNISQMKWFFISKLKYYQKIQQIYDI